MLSNQEVKTILTSILYPRAVVAVIVW